uniref:Putative secreted protein n=1 Tax=Ixodes ricinus TaxID=34613 RepID=A0A6B0UBH0_IXORI
MTSTFFEAAAILIFTGMRGRRCSYCSHAPYHPSCGFDACFVVFFIETDVELYAVCLISKEICCFAFNCSPGVSCLQHQRYENFLGW